MWLRLLEEAVATQNGKPQWALIRKNRSFFGTKTEIPIYKIAEKPLNWKSHSPPSAYLSLYSLNFSHLVRDPVCGPIRNLILIFPYRVFVFFVSDISPMPRMTLAFHIWRSLVWWTLVSVCHETITYPCIFASGWIVEVVENYSNLRDLSNQKHLDLGGRRRHDFPHGDYNLVHSRTFRHPSGLWREMRRY